MTSWNDLADAEPAFATRVRERFGIARHCTMATLRRDGGPRISGTEVEFGDGGLFVGSMANAVKALDLRRDPRVALHSPTVDPSEDNTSWAGEAKIAGRAEEIGDHAGEDGSHRFRIYVTEVVLTRLGEPADHLVIESWHPDRGLERRERR
ncbi:MAG TPA: pyridoxamine 5'-phosphate oxidase family protein [Actinophytocola sp.]|uniref:pyridoxamine 5'-phosphate oxidase family protein n=1 Tax=Actinophytocola sp. TaxID=1872138 RepID=UPI002DBFCAF4|nr:pyridoxamine 5'-phosphate oxidase family protein [Actinophytocola sp.]HEU5469434.1 pyridoxamine 5'-phosphate oxidase family protein [Actinophytocola sp.]